MGAKEGGEVGGKGEGWRAGLSVDTRLCHPVDMYRGDPYEASAPPLYQTATFNQPSATTFGEYDYTRSGNPTRAALERTMAELEGADRSFAYASGMAALAAVVKVARAGERVVAGDDIYGGTSRLLAQVVAPAGVEVVNVDMTDLAAVRAAIDARTSLVMIESPTNPRLQVCDVAAIAELAHAGGRPQAEGGCVVCVDNSIMTSVLQRPLELGADVCMTSATKYICGHSDVTGGVLSVTGARHPALADKLYFHQNAEGTGLAPFDCWLCLRGLKTMSLRLRAQQANARRLAEFLDAHPLVKRVNYPGLPGHPGEDLHARQATGPGAILSFTTDDLELSKALVEGTSLFKVTVSFGNVTSLISLPCFMSHASIPADVRAARGLPDDLVRISAGIEDPDDLIRDLAAAFDAYQAR